MSKADFDAIENLFGIGNIFAPENPVQIIIFGVYFTTAVKTAPIVCYAHGRPSDASKQGHYAYRQIIYIALGRPSFTGANLAKMVEEELDHDEALGISDWRGITYRYQSRTQTFKVKLGNTGVEFSDAEARYIADQIISQIRFQRDPRRQHAFDIRDANDHKLEASLRAAIAPSLTKANLRLDLIMNYESALFLRLNRVDPETGDIDKGPQHKISYGADKAMKKRLLALMAAQETKGGYALHPLLDAYLSKAYPDTKQAIIEEAGQRLSETWNIANDNGTQGHVWIKVIKGEICGRFPLGEHVVWAYDKLTLKPAFFKGMPETVRDGLMARLAPGNLLETIIDMTEIPGMEHVRIMHVSEGREEVSIKLDVKAAA